MFGRASPFADLPPGSRSADGLNNQALAATVLGDEAGAETAWQNALQTTPLHTLSTYNLAVARWRRGEITDQAVVRYVERARAAAPGDWSATECLALVHLERGESGAALALLEEAAAQAPAGADVHATLARLRAAAPQDNRATQRLRGHAGFVSAAVIGDGGRAVFSAGDDGTVRVWDIAGGRPVRTLEAHGRRTSSLSVSADGELALSASDEGSLKLWDMRSGRCVKTIAAGGAVFSASLSADGTRVAASSTGSDNFLGVDSTLLQVWDVSKERCLGKLVGHTNAAKAICLSPDGLTVATGGDDHTVRVWEVSGACKKVMDGHVHYVSCVLLTADGEHVLSGSWDQTMRLWQIKSGRCVRVFSKSGAIVTSVAMTPDGRIAVSGCWDGTVRLWEVATGRCIRTFHSHTRMVTSVAIDPGGRFAVSSSWDATVCVHDLRSIPLGGAGACVPKLAVQSQYARLPSPEPEPEELVEAAEQARREGKLAVALDRLRRARAHPDRPAPEGAARLWRELTRHCRRTGLRAVWKSASWTPAGRIDTFQPLEDSSRVLIAGEAGLQAWEIDLNRTLRKLPGHAARVVSLAVDAEKRSALSGSADGTLRWWDLSSGASRVAMRGHGSIVAAVALSADERQAVSGSYDHAVRLWDLNGGHCTRELRGHRRQVTAVCAGAGGWLCASGDYEGTILVWSDDGPPIPLAGHTARLTALRFVGDGMRLLSASADGTLRLWDLAARGCARLLEGHRTAVLGADCSADGRWCVSSAANGSLRLWDLGGEASYELADGLEGGGNARLADEDCAVVVADRRGLHVFELEWELEAAEKTGPDNEA
jgi:WD40 repeat protein